MSLRDGDREEMQALPPAPDDGVLESLDDGDIDAELASIFGDAVEALITPVEPETAAKHLSAVLASMREMATFRSAATFAELVDHVVSSPPEDVAVEHIRSASAEARLVAASGAESAVVSLDAALRKRRRARVLRVGSHAAASVAVLLTATTGLAAADVLPRTAGRVIVQLADSIGVPVPQVIRREADSETAAPASETKPAARTARADEKPRSAVAVPATEEAEVTTTTVEAPETDALSTTTTTEVKESKSSPDVTGSTDTKTDDTTTVPENPTPSGDETVTVLPDPQPACPSPSTDGTTDTTGTPGGDGETTTTTEPSDTTTTAPPDTTTTTDGTTQNGTTTTTTDGGCAPSGSGAHSGDGEDDTAPSAAQRAQEQARREREKERERARRARERERAKRESRQATETDSRTVQSY